MKNTICIILFYLISNFVFSQKQIDDSLLSKLHKINDENKSEFYYQLLKHTPNDSLKKMIEYAENAVYFSQLTKTDSVHALFLNQLGLLFYSKSNYILAEKYFRFSLDYEEKRMNLINIAKLYSNIAVIYELKGEYNRAIEMYLNALKIFENKNYIKGLAFVNNNIGVVYEEMKRKEESIKYHRKALALKKQLNDSMGIASSYNNLGVVYEELYRNFDSAFFYYNHALNIYSKLKKTINYATTTVNIARLIQLKGNKTLALKLYFEALEIYDKEKNNQGKSWCYRNIGQLYIDNSDFENAFINFQLSIKIAKHLNDKKTVLDLTGLLADLYYKQGNYKLSSDFLKEYNSLNDSLLNSINLKNINELKIKYQTSQLQFDNDLLQKDNQLKSEHLQRNKIIIGALFFTSILIIISFLLFRARIKLKHEKIQSQIEQKLLRLQMNPHFISNALSSIQNFVYQNKPTVAGDYLSSFSRLMRQTIKFTRKELIQLDEEIQSLNDYIKIQQLRFENQFDYEILIDKEIDSEHVLIYPMFIQPFVENSIVHGFKNLSYKGKLLITFQKVNKLLEILIIDNGNGLKQQTNHEENNTSYSLQITKERIYYLNKQNKQKASIVVNNIENRKTNGVSVKLILPFIE